MSWDLHPRPSFKTVSTNGYKLILEGDDNGYYMMIKNEADIGIPIKLTQDQMIELKFWLAMNVGNEK